MFRIFNMLLQNLANLGFGMSDVTYRATYTEFKFTDANGKKYTLWLTQEKEEENKDA